MTKFEDEVPGVAPKIAIKGGRTFAGAITALYVKSYDINPILLGERDDSVPMEDAAQLFGGIAVLIRLQGWNLEEFGLVSRPTVFNNFSKNNVPFSCSFSGENFGGILVKPKEFTDMVFDRLDLDTEGEYDFIFDCSDGPPLNPSWSSVHDVLNRSIKRVIPKDENLNGPVFERRENGWYTKFPLKGSVIEYYSYNSNYISQSQAEADAGFTGEVVEIDNYVNPNILTSKLCYNGRQALSSHPPLDTVPTIYHDIARFAMQYLLGERTLEHMSGYIQERIDDSLRFFYYLNGQDLYHTPFWDDYYQKRDAAMDGVEVSDRLGMWFNATIKPVKDNVY
jgi:hypothetical protein